MGTLKIIFLNLSLWLALVLIEASPNSSRVANIPRNCWEVMKNRTNKADIYLINVPTSDLPPFYVFCAFDGSTIIQTRFNGKEEFFRNWQDYKNGFGKVYDEYWLGLERIHALTQDQPYELQVKISRFESYATYYAYYYKFDVASEAEGYKLTIDSYNGAAYDCLSDCNGAKFSTYDRNNFPFRENMANEYRSGFWFPHSKFLAGNLNGPHRGLSNRITMPGITWYCQFKNQSMENVHMALRPINK